jgi:hypothetical protein
VFSGLSIVFLPELSFGSIAANPGFSCMTRKQVESAIESVVPFTLRMADGKEYTVPHADYIWRPPNASYAIVHEDNGHFTVLPLLTMAGLRSKPANGAGKKK